MIAFFIVAPPSFLYSLLALNVAYLSKFRFVISRSFVRFSFFSVAACAQEWCAGAAPTAAAAGVSEPKG
ncbi:hypothetical protein D3C86_2151290 [compost metagenome]